MKLETVKEWFASHWKIAAAGAAALCVAGCGIWFGVSWHTYKSAEKEADTQIEMAESIRDQMINEPAEPVKDISDADVPEISDVSGNDEASEPTKYDLGLLDHQTDENMRERINFDKLDELIENKDVHSWLYLPDTPVDYLVMQGDDEEPLKYLWKDIYGDDSKTGSLFVLAENGMQDDHTVIYGHRLKNHDIYFGPLLSFRDTEYADAHKYAYTYDRDKVTKWELVYAVEGDESDPVYMYPYVNNSDEWYYLDADIQGRAFWSSGEIGADDHMLVLSTCSGPSTGLPQRLYLVYRDVSYWEYE